MLSKFYVVQKNGVPSIWQADAKRIGRLLKHKAGFTVISETPYETRTEALTKLRELFPGARPVRSN